MNCIALTFDDGFIEHYEIAKYLAKVDIPATFFIITGLLEYQGKNLLISNPGIVRELLDMGHEIGSHTHTHKDLTQLSPDEIIQEITLSLDSLRKLGVDYKLGLAYPYGSFNEIVIDIAKKNFNYARTMGRFNRWNEKASRYMLGGIGIRHIIKYPFKKFFSNVKLVNIVFHEEPLWTVKLVIDYLRLFNVKFVTLREGLKCLTTL